MLALLRQEYVNCWLLAKDLEAIATRDGGPEMATLCKALRANYGYPVDSVLVGPDLRVVGHVNVHDVMTDADAYVAFLRAGLTAVGRTPPEAAVAKPAAGVAAPRPKELRLTPEQPTASLLDVVRRLGFGQMSFAYYGIDASAFADGGVIEIEVRVGRATTAAVFELCAATDLPGDEKAPGGRRVMQPVQTKSVAREGSDKLVHAFAKGDRFGLVVKPAEGSAEGDSNAFLATVKVRRP